MLYSILIYLLLLFQKTFLNLKFGNLHLSAAARKSIDACFNKNVLSLYSYRGKTKKN